MSNGTNGNGWKTWALGIMFTLFLATGGATYNSMDNRVTAIESKDLSHVATVVDVAVLKKSLEVISAQQAEATQAMKDLKEQQRLQQAEFNKTIRSLEAKQKELAAMQERILFEVTRPR